MEEQRHLKEGWESSTFQSSITTVVHCSLIFLDLVILDTLILFILLKFLKKKEGQHNPTRECSATPKGERKDHHLTLF